MGVNPYQTYLFIRQFTDRPMTTLEATAGCVAKAVMDVDAGLVVLASRDPAYVRYVCKYRPKVSAASTRLHLRAASTAWPACVVFPAVTWQLCLCNDLLEGHHQIHSHASTH